MGKPALGAPLDDPPPRAEAADRIKSNDERLRLLRSALDSIAYSKPIEGNPHGALWQAQKRAREALAKDDVLRGAK